MISGKSLKSKGRPGPSIPGSFDFLSDLPRSMLLATARGDLDFKIQKPTQLLNHFLGF